MRREESGQKRERELYFCEVEREKGFTFLKCFERDLRRETADRGQQNLAKSHNIILLETDD